MKDNIVTIYRGYEGDYSTYDSSKVGKDIDSTCDTGRIKEAVGTVGRE